LFYTLLNGDISLINLTGPLVRITPDEVHLIDPSNYELINFVGSKWPKSDFYDTFAVGYSTFSTRSPDLHRIRRSALSPFFSRKMVLELEGIVQDKASRLISRAKNAFAAGQALNLHFAFRSISVDVISEYAFSQCYDFLDRPDLGEEFFGMVQRASHTMWVFQQSPALRKFALSLPRRVASFLSPPVGQTLRMKEVRA
jgi:cytochrome P450